MTSTRVISADAALPVGAETIHVYRSGLRLIRVAEQHDRVEEESEPESRARFDVPAAEVRRARDLLDALRPDRVHTEEDEAAAALLLDDGLLIAYVELRGPPDRTMSAALAESGLAVLGYRPVDSYLCRGTPDAFTGALALAFLHGVIPLTGALKPVPRLSEDQAEVVVTVAAAGDAAARIRSALHDLTGVRVVPGTAEPTPEGFRIRVVTDSDGVEALRRMAAVLAIEAFAHRQNEDEVADLILAGELDSGGRPHGDYLRWLTEQGVSGAGVTIAVVDDGVDESHPALAGRITAKDSGAGSHGTMVAGQVAGRYLAERDPLGFRYGLGVAPDAEMLSLDNSALLTDLAADTARGAGPGGFPATIQNNSWGTSVQNPMTYGSDESVLDRLVRNATGGTDGSAPLAICFSAGNKGAAGLTRPKAAKNIIVTGNSENFRPEVGGADADQVSDVYSGPSGSSHGVCGDGRIRPDVLAPGQWTASANFGVGPDDERYISPTLRWGSGTSAASPKIAGACAVLTEWWRWNNDGATPSPAMLRALLINQAVDTRFAGPVPNPRQGWGRADIGAVLRDDHRRTYVDETVMLLDPGDRHRLELRVSDPGAPVRVTLVWTDPAGAVGSGTPAVPAVVNRLALRVDAEGRAYHGNVFAAGTSVAGSEPPADRLGNDNVQNVFLDPGTVTGTLTVTVSAVAVPLDCLSGSADEPRQDFALVVDNAYPATPETGSVVLVDTSAQDDDPDDGDFWGAADSDALHLDSGRWTEIEEPPPVGTLGEPAAVPPARPPLPLAQATIAALWPVGTPGLRREPLAEAALPQHAGAGTAAVVVIGGGTRFTGRVLARLRRYAFLGELHLVSASSAVLDFAIARIGRRTGVHAHLAAQPAMLAREVRRTVAALGGGQRADRTDQAQTATVQVIGADRELVLVLADATGTGVVRATAAGPDGSVTQLANREPGTDATTVAGLRPPGAGAWAGTWRIATEGGHLEDVFAYGPPPARVQLRVDGRGRDTEEESTGVVLAAGVAGSEIIALDRAASRTSEEPVPAQAVRLRPAGATVVAVRCRGRDVHGHPFARWADLGAVRLESRTAWLSRLAARNVVVTVREIAIDGDGVVTGLTVGTRAGLRSLRITDRALARALPPATLAGRELTLALRGEEVLAFSILLPTDDIHLESPR